MIAVRGSHICSSINIAGLKHRVTQMLGDVRCALVRINTLAGMFDHFMVNVRCQDPNIPLFKVGQNVGNCHGD
jgi:hypothetical protein